jgi:hypothetical protein
MDSHSPLEMIRRLREQLGRREAMTGAEELGVFSSGAAALDRLLPGGGLRYGMLVEWLGGGGGSGVEEQWSRGKEKQKKSYSTSSAVTLSLLAAGEACRQGGVLVVIDRERTFYPPAAAAWGINLARLIIVRPRTARDALWAAVQSLRSPAVAATWTTADRLDPREFRRLQLAAREGHTLGLVVRPACVRGQLSWADVQIAVDGMPSNLDGTPRASGDGRATRGVNIYITRLRGGRPGGQVTLEIDDSTPIVREMKEGRRLSAIGYQPGLLADSR